MWLSEPAFLSVRSVKSFPGTSSCESRSGPNNLAFAVLHNQADGVLFSSFSNGRLRPQMSTVRVSKAAGERNKLVMREMPQVYCVAASIRRRLPKHVDI